MLAGDSYQSIGSACEGIFREKGSRFIAYAYPFESDHELKEVLARLRAEHSKARHFCWAFRLTPDTTIFRFNDDGEPSGSAGRPILNTILSSGLTNILVVVVRYFGGTLLGVPGLIHAYKTATLEALNNCIVVGKTVNDRYLVSFPYSATNHVMKILKDEELKMLHQKFDIDCAIEFELRQSRIATILGKLENIEGVSCQLLK
jgi:uncharacterized YigZ family protein